MNNQKRYSFQAYHFTDVLKLKELDRLFSVTALSQSSTKLVYREDEGSYFFIYRFGSVVFFNIDPARQAQIMVKIRSIIGEKPESVSSEEFFVEVNSLEKDTVGFNGATLTDLSLDKIDILALVLARSTALEFFENRVEELLKKTGDLGDALRLKGRLAQRATNIKKFIGHCITTKQNLVSTAYLLDKPDETWRDQVLDNLYHSAVEMFEIRDRYKTVDYKLRMIQENLELISELLQYRNANSLEWAIIILIAVDIVLYFFQPFFNGH